MSTTADDTPRTRRRIYPLPVGLVGEKTGGWWGMLMLIATEASIFVYLFFSFFYLQSMTHNAWPPAGKPPLPYALSNTGILILSIFTMWMTERAAHRGRRILVPLGLFFQALVGTCYVLLTLVDWHAEGFAFNDGAYASLFFLIGGMHLAHAIIGVLVLFMLTLWSLLGHITRERCTSVTVIALYWYFLVAVWLAIFGIFYVIPYVTPL
jgi:cytochrome c oxidase subunit 3